MLTTLAVESYRSLRSLVLPLGRLNVVTGPNGSGKSNLYRALRLLGETAQGGVVQALAREGGLPSTFWAGPETISRRMRQGEVPIEGGPRKKPVRLKLGFAGEDFGYAIALGLPQPSSSAFALDPEIKRELIWAGPTARPASLLVDRDHALVKVRAGRAWDVVASHLSPFDSLFAQVADARTAAEVLALRERIRGWRFYDHFRTDPDAPARQPQLATRTPVLAHDGRDLPAALQTILEVGDADGLRTTVADAFPGATLAVTARDDGRLAVELAQEGLLRPLAAAELSDGTLRYLLLAAALMTPRPPALMVVNEPESSLHPDLLPALARLMTRAARDTQLWVVSHASRLVAALEREGGCERIELEKAHGETRVVGQRPLDAPPWQWLD
jgi:predicted ATPase